MEKAKKNIGRKSQKGRKSGYDDSFKRKVARQYLNTNQSLAEVANQYGVKKIDVSNWKKRFSNELAEDIIVFPMTEQEQKDMKALQKQIEALKKKLEYEEMKIFALETMIDLAKTELGIDVRKNYGAKQPEE